MLIVLGCALSLTAYLPELWFLWLLAGLEGASSGAIDTAGNVLCMDVWKGSNGGPAMHAIHFAFSVGAFVIPVISTPFLRIVDEAEGSNKTTITPIGLEDTGIDTLYVGLGIFVAFISIGFLALYALEMFSEPKNQAVKADSEQEEKATYKAKCRYYQEITLLAIMSLFFFTYVGTVVSFGSFLPVFAVRSHI